MLALNTFYPTLPADDIDRARRFYEGILGLEVAEGYGGSDGVFFRLGQGLLLVYKTLAPRGGNTALSFVVDDLEAQMKELRDRGVVFEEYDMPNLKTHDGIAEFEGLRGAWFKDSEGNILSLGQPSAEQLRLLRVA
jgi:catechol 2,3-dioxygenase-like lactoylglutathione lyase family enzyme